MKRNAVCAGIAKALRGQRKLLFKSTKKISERLVEIAASLPTSSRALVVSSSFFSVIINDDGKLLA